MKEKRNWLLYLTNDEAKPRKEWLKDEVLFDIIFFIVITVATIISVPILIWVGVSNKDWGEFAWGFIVLIFYIEAWDGMRHNRD